MNFLEKLDFLMNKFDLNKRTLSINSDIPYTTIDNWYKRGYEGLKLPTLRKLAEYFNTSLDYWIKDEILDPNYGKSVGFEVDYSEMEHVKKFRKLDARGKEVVELILSKEYEYSTIKILSNQSTIDVTDPFADIPATYEELRKQHPDLNPIEKKKATSE